MGDTQHFSFKNGQFNHYKKNFLGRFTDPLAFIPISYTEANGMRGNYNDQVNLRLVDAKKKTLNVSFDPSKPCFKRFLNCLKAIGATFTGNKRHKKRVEQWLA